jgi:hypothetical protein
VPQAKNALKSGGHLLMEISGTIVERVKELVDDWDDVRIIPDLQSIPRIVVARKR